MDIIREDFFHFLWRNIHFSLSDLHTTGDETVRIIHPGYHNGGDGPDYRFARIRLDGILFYGDVELHKSSSEWYHHGHHRDPRYNRVILHVVIHEDSGRRDVQNSEGHRIPTLELKRSMPPSLSRLWRAFHRPVTLPCSGLIGEIPKPALLRITRKWDRAYFRHRIDRMLHLYPDEKPMSEAWLQMLTSGVFQGLGYHKNQENMLRLANLLHRGAVSGYHPNDPEKDANTRPGTGSETPAATPPDTCRNTKTDKKPDVFPISDDANIIRSLTETLLQISGLHPQYPLLQSGTDSSEDIETGPPSTIPAGTEATASGRTYMLRHDWDFSASRPANQPKARIRQAAELYIRLSQSGTRAWLKSSPEILWRDLCRLNHAPAIGKNRRDVLFSNVVIPSVYLLSRWLDHRRQRQKTLALWESQNIPLPEKPDRILRQSGFPPGNHYKRLAMLHHFKYYCTGKRCGECEVMNYLAQT